MVYSSEFKKKIRKVYKILNFYIFLIIFIYNE